MTDCVPRESTGHALPPPVPAEQVCRLEPSEWENYWKTWQFRKQEPCCVCGRWVSHKSAYSGPKNILHINVRRRLGSALEELHYCRGCRRKCRKCHKSIPDEQIRQRGFCEICIITEKNENGKK